MQWEDTVGRCGTSSRNDGNEVSVRKRRFAARRSRPEAQHSMGDRGRMTFEDLRDHVRRRKPGRRLVLDACFAGDVLVAKRRIASLPKSALSWRKPVSLWSPMHMAIENMNL